ncbi:MAG: hypothetical protein HY401_05485 [Elusimicrobia bacterium]|nr:hypothetical protein [Elusimicrobiota bacterium]
MIFCLIGAIMSTSASAAFLPKNRPYDASHYAINMRLDAAAGRFTASVKIDLTLAQAAAVIELDAEELEIQKARLAGKELKFDYKAPSGPLTIYLSGIQPAGKKITLEVDYTGRSTSRHEGFFKVVDPGDPERLPLFFTHFEALSARKVFPCNDEPYDKATTEVIVEVDSRYQILSNGRKLSDESIESQDGALWRRVRWLQEKPHSTYLVNIAAGQFGALEAFVEGVPVQIYTSPKKVKEAQFSLEVIKKSFVFLKNFYGVAYPWDHYAMVGIPGFAWGGMENTTLTSMRESAVIIEDASAEIQKFRIASVVTHELAHQWFGDLVTMKWWDDLWLNEAFASYMETLATGDFFGHEYADVASAMDTWEDYYRQEDGPRSHPIVSKELPTPDDAFDSTNYTKGERVLRMLDFYIGRDNFRKGLNIYLTRYALGNASYQDFFRAMEEASGASLQSFVDGWLVNRGYPVVTVDERWDEARKTMVVRVSQRSNHAAESTLFHFKLPVVFHRLGAPAYSRESVILINSPQTNFEIQLPAKPEWVTWNPGFAALIKLTRQNGAEGQWALQAKNDPDPVARIQALFELLGSWVDRNAADLNPLTEAATKTLSEILTGDPSPYVRQAVLDKLLDSKWTRFPNDLARPTLDLAQNPQGLRNNDLQGTVLVRSRALAFLGKTSYEPGRVYAARMLQDRSLGLDLLSGVASAMAGYSDQQAVESLREALALHGPRGYPFRRTVLLAFGLVQNPDVVLELSRIAKSPDANNEIIGGIFNRLQDNRVLKNSSKTAEFIKNFILEKDGFSDEMKSRALEVLEESKSQEIRPALETIVKDSSSQRLRALAQNILKKNFN